jgi:hypothetical protein
MHIINIFSYFESAKQEAVDSLSLNDKQAAVGGTTLPSINPE